MIGKVMKGASFGGCINYCLQDKRGLSEEQKKQMSLEDGLKHSGRAEVLDFHLCFGDKKELAEQFRDVAKLSRNVEKPVLHLTLRAAPGDQLTRAQWIEIGRAAAKEFGVDDHQYLSILHNDTQQPHIHIVANRVGYDGKVASDSNSYKRMAQLARRLEKEYNLQSVLSPRRFLTQEERQLPRQDERKQRLKEKIGKALKGTATYPEFEKKIVAEGYRVDKGRGIAFEDDKNVRIKGSEVGYSLNTIEGILTRNRQALLKEQQAHQRQVQEAIRQSQRHPKGGQASQRAPAQGAFLTPMSNPGSAGGLPNLINILMRPEPSGGSGGGPDSWEDEERRKKKKKGLRP